MADETKQPTITSANLPKPPVTAASPAAPTAVIHDDDIVAKALGTGFKDIRPANPAISFRWINRVAGSGARYDQAKSLGFVNALVADVSKETPCPVHWQKDGALLDGDLILMKMARVDYVGQLKLNEQNAVRRLSHVNTIETGNRELGNAMNEVQGSAVNKAKIRLYNPNQ